MRGLRKCCALRGPPWAVLVPLAAAGLVLVLVTPALAVSVTLTDANSTATFHLGGEQPAGMVDWTVDGTHQVYQQWFWYRVGATGPEQRLESGTTETVVFVPVLFPDMLRATYTKPGEFEVIVTYTLMGGQPGSRMSDMSELISIKSLKTSGSLDFHFFQYSDFDLNGTPNDDVAWIEDGLLDPHRAVQTDSAINMVETVVTPRANHAEVGLDSATVDKLNDGLPTMLDDLQRGPVAGDATWAFEWDRTIGPNGSFLISKNKLIGPVPEPVTMAGLGLGIAGLVGYIRRRRVV